MMNQQTYCYPQQQPLRTLSSKLFLILFLSLSMLMTFLPSTCLSMTPSLITNTEPFSQYLHRQIQHHQQQQHHQQHPWKRQRTSSSSHNNLVAAAGPPPPVPDACSSMADRIFISTEIIDINAFQQYVQQHLYGHQQQQQQQQQPHPDANGPQQPQQRVVQYTASFHVEWFAFYVFNLYQRDLFPTVASIRQGLVLLWDCIDGLAAAGYAVSPLPIDSLQSTYRRFMQQQETLPPYSPADLLIDILTTETKAWSDTTLGLGLLKHGLSSSSSVVSDGRPRAVRQLLALTKRLMPTLSSAPWALTHDDADAEEKDGNRGSGSGGSGGSGRRSRSLEAIRGTNAFDRIRRSSARPRNESELVFKFLQQSVALIDAVRVPLESNYIFVLYEIPMRIAELAFQADNEIVLEWMLTSILFAEHKDRLDRSAYQQQQQKEQEQQNHNQQQQQPDHQQQQQQKQPQRKRKERVGPAEKEEEAVAEQWNPLLLCEAIAKIKSTVFRGLSLKHFPRITQWYSRFSEHRPCPPLQDTLDWDDLPVEILGKIAEHLSDEDDIHSFASVNRQMNQVVNSLPGGKWCSIFRNYFDADPETKHVSIRNKGLLHVDLEMNPHVSPSPSDVTFMAAYYRFMCLNALVKDGYTVNPVSETAAAAQRIPHHFLSGYVRAIAYGPNAFKDTSLGLALLEHRMRDLRTLYFLVLLRRLIPTQTPELIRIPYNHWVDTGLGPALRKRWALPVFAKWRFYQAQNDTDMVARSGRVMGAADVALDVLRSRLEPVVYKELLWNVSEIAFQADNDIVLRWTLGHLNVTEKALKCRHMIAIKALRFSGHPSSQFPRIMAWYRTRLHTVAPTECPMGPLLLHDGEASSNNNNNNNNDDGMIPKLHRLPDNIITKVVSQLTSGADLQRLRSVNSVFREMVPDTSGRFSCLHFRNYFQFNLTAGTVTFKKHVLSLMIEDLLSDDPELFDDWDWQFKLQKLFRKWIKCRNRLRMQFTLVDQISQEDIEAYYLLVSARMGLELSEAPMSPSPSSLSIASQPSSPSSTRSSSSTAPYGSIANPFAPIVDEMAFKLISVSEDRVVEEERPFAFALLRSGLLDDEHFGVLATALIPTRFNAPHIHTLFETHETTPPAARSRYSIARARARATGARRRSAGAAAASSSAGATSRETTSKRLAKRANLFSEYRTVRIREPLFFVEVETQERLEQLSDQLLHVIQSGLVKTITNPLTNDVEYLQDVEDKLDSLVHIVTLIAQSAKEVENRYLAQRLTGCTFIQGVAHEIGVLQHVLRAPSAYAQIFPNKETRRVYQSIVGCSQLESEEATEDDDDDDDDSENMDDASIDY